MKKKEDRCDKITIKYKVTEEKTFVCYPPKSKALLKKNLFGPVLCVMGFCAVIDFIMGCMISAICNMDDTTWAMISLLIALNICFIAFPVGDAIEEWIKGRGLDYGDEIMEKYCSENPDEKERYEQAKKGIMSTSETIKN